MTTPTLTLFGVLAAEPTGADNTFAFVIVAAGVVAVLFVKRMLAAPDTPGKFMGVLLGLLAALVVFGVGWEVAECAAGRHFGNPGDGSNPFDQACPTTKTNGAGQ